MEFKGSQIIHVHSNLGWMKKVQGFQVILILIKFTKHHSSQSYLVKINVFFEMWYVLYHYCWHSLIPRFRSKIKIIHFIGAVKPWQHHYVVENETVVFAPGTHGSQQGAYDFIKKWWEVWNSQEEVSRTCSRTDWSVELYTKTRALWSTYPVHSSEELCSR